MSAEPLTLAALQRLALEWCPKKARWNYLMTSRYSWGPAHEIGHALVEPRIRHSMDSYGRCSVDACRCRGGGCLTFEAAAMLISSRLLHVVGHPELSRAEIEATDGYDRIDELAWKRGRALARKKLGRVPRTVQGLEGALRRRMKRAA